MSAPGVPYRLDLIAETTIYQNEVKCRVLENDFNYSQNPTAKKGTLYGTTSSATIVITALGAVGCTITLQVDDPDYGLITLGSYATTSADITIEILAAHIVEAISTNVYGYTATVSGNVITLKARPGLEVSLNGQELIVEITNCEGRIFDDTFDGTFN